MCHITRRYILPSVSFVRVIWVSCCRSVTELLAGFCLGHCVFYCFGASLFLLGDQGHGGLITYSTVPLPLYWSKTCTLYKKGNILAPKRMKMFTGGFVQKLYLILIVQVLCSFKGRRGGYAKSDFAWRGGLRVRQKKISLQVASLFLYYFKSYCEVTL